MGVIRCVIVVLALALGVAAGPCPAATITGNTFSGKVNEGQSGPCSSAQSTTLATNELKGFMVKMLPTYSSGDIGNHRINDRFTVTNSYANSVTAPTFRYFSPSSLAGSPIGSDVATNKPGNNVQIINFEYQGAYRMVTNTSGFSSNIMMQKGMLAVPLYNNVAISTAGQEAMWWGLSTTGCSSFDAVARQPSGVTLTTTGTLFNVVFNVQGTSPGPYALCTSLNGGQDWFTSSIVNVTAVATYDAVITQMSQVPLYEPTSPAGISVSTWSYTFNPQPIFTVALSPTPSCSTPTLFCLTTWQVGTLLTFTGMGSLPPGNYSVCLSPSGSATGFTASSFWLQTATANKIYIIRATAYSITSITPSVIAPTASAVVFTITGSTASGAGLFPCGTCKAALTTTSACPGTGSFASISSSGGVFTFSWAPATAGTYKLCYSVNNGNTPSISDSVSLSAIATGPLFIGSISPSVVGYGTSPFFTISVNGTYPSTAKVGLTLDSSPNCGTIQASASVTTNQFQFPSPLNFLQSSGPTVVYVCFSADGSSYNRQIYSNTIVGQGPSNVLTAVTPSVVVAVPTGSLVPLAFSPTPVSTATGTVIRLSTTADCAFYGATLTQNYADAPLVFTNVPAGTYYACYSMDGGANFYRQPTFNLSVIAGNVTSLSITASTLVRGRAGQTMQVAGGPPVVSTAYIFFAADCSILSTPTFQYTTLPMTLSVLTSATTATRICFTVDGITAFAQNSNPMTSFIEDYTGASMTTSTPSTIIATGQSLTITYTASILASSQIVYAPTGLCTSPSAYFTAQLAFTGASISPTFTIPATFTSQSLWTVYPCLSLLSGAYVQQLSGSMQVAGALPTTITRLNPSSFIVGFSVTMSLDGASPTPFTKIGITKTTCTAALDCSVSYTSTTSITCPSYATAQTVYICYSVDGGATYQKQILVAAVIITDPLANSVSSIVPGLFGAGFVLPISVALVPGSLYGVNAYIGFTSIVGSCGTCSSTCEGVMNFATAGVPVTLPSGFSTARSQWGVCFSSDGKASWSAQVGVGATLKTISAASNAIVGLSPSQIGLTTTHTFTLTPGADPAIGSVTSMVGFSLNPSCAPASSVNAYPLPQGQVTVTFTAGTAQYSAQNFTLCYSTDNGTTFVAQNVRLQIVDATSGVVTSITPNLVGEFIQPTIAMTTVGAILSVDSVVSFALQNCTTSLKQNVFALTTTTNVPITASLAAGQYVVCLSTRPGVWVQQAPTLQMQGTTPTTLTSQLVPAVIGTGTTPPITFPSVPVTGTTYVAFVNSQVDCGNPSSFFGLTQITSSGSNVLQTAINVVSDRTVYVCLTTNFGATPTNWKLQVNTNLTLLRATATSVSGFNPVTFGASVPLTVALSIVGGPTPYSQVAFSQTSDGCGNTGARVSPTNYVGTSLNVAAFTNPGLYLACYTVDGINWVAQTRANFTIVKATVGSLSTISPVHIGALNAENLTVAGLQPTPTTAVAFTTTAGCSLGTLSPIVMVTTPGQTQIVSPQLADGDYFICYTTDLFLYQQQANFGIMLYVRQATDSSITSFTPLVFGTNVQPQLALIGADLTPQAQISFALYGSCASGPRVGVTPYAYSVQLASPIVNNNQTGTFQLCYSVNPNTWVGQSAFYIFILYPTPGDLTNIDPPNMGAGTHPNFTLTFQFSMFTALSKLSFIPAGLDCMNPTQRSYDMNLTTTMFPLKHSLHTGGQYEVCITHNSIDWVKQLLQLKVIGADNNTISTITPTIYQNGVAVEVTIDGLPVTPTSRIAFAYPGGCFVAATRYAETAWQPIGGRNSTLMASPIQTGVDKANLTLCYSVNGEDFFEQVKVRVLVITACDNINSCGDCHTNPFCTWCITENICAVNLDKEKCPANVLVPPTAASCPTVTFPTVDVMSGSIAGHTNMSVTFSTPFLPSANMTCRWDFVVSQNYTPMVVTSPSTGWCLSPAAITPDTESASVTIRYRDVPFTTSAAGSWTYYPCSPSPLCDQCWSASRPDCGMCFKTSTCQAEFECEDLWGGRNCPTVSLVDPASINFRGGDIYVEGTLMVNSSALICSFQDLLGNQLAYANASWVNETSVVCTAPGADPNTVVQVWVRHHDRQYSDNSASLLYVPDPVVAQVVVPPAPVQANPLVIPLASVIGALALIGLIVLVIFGHRRRKMRMLLMPPTLTTALKESIIFGEFKGPATTRHVYPHIGPLMELLMIPNSPVLAAIARCCESTESDQISRALVYVAESRRRTVDVMKDLVTQEVAVAESMSTLFRTNSFVTKMFKVYSKIAGLEYLHATLGYEINASLHAAKSGADEEGGGLDVKDDSNDDVQLNKLILLTVCQRVFLAVTKSEKTIPTPFRELFSHVRTCMQTKFPAGSAQLARLTAGNLSANLVETQQAMRESTKTFSLMELATIQGKLINSIVGAEIDSSMQGNLTDLVGNVETLSNQLASTLKACRDMEASFYPDSEAAKRVIAEHNQAQNAIAVGGFFFLRFLVPAITAPDAYALMREPPDGNTIKTLVLCGKVLQNLSNDKEMGGKEAYMAKMNEFIISNRRLMQKFQSNVMVKKDSDAGAYDPVAVPQRHVEAASAYLYEYIATRLKNIMAALDTPQPGEDDKAALTRAQMANMLIYVLTNIQKNAGEHAAKAKNRDGLLETITAARSTREHSTLSTMKTTRIQAVADEPTDPAAGLGSVSGMGSFASMSGMDSMGSADSRAAKRTSIMVSGPMTAAPSSNPLDLLSTGKRPDDDDLFN